MKQAEQDDRPVHPNSAVGQMHVDVATGRLLRVNQALCAMLGYAAHELVSRPWLELIHPDDRERDRQLFARLAAGELGAAIDEQRLLCKDGATQWVFASAVSMGDGSGAPRSILVLLHDIAERKRAEQNARFVAALSAGMLPLSDVQSAIALLTGRLVAHLEVTACFVDELDEASDQLIIRGGAGLALAADETACRLSLMPATLREALQAGQSVTIEDTANDPRTSGQFHELYAPHGIRSLVAVPRMRDGRWAASLLVCDLRPRLWSPGDIAFLRSVADLAWLAIERLRSLAELRRSNDGLTLALSATRGFIYEYDPASGHVWRSDGFAQVLGYSLEEAPKRAEWWAEQIHPDDRQLSAQHGGRPTAGLQNEYSLEYRVRHKDGHYRTVWDRGVITRDGEGRPARVFGHTIDITERKAAEEELRHANERLTLALSATDGFIYEYDPATRAVTRSPGLRQLTGYEVAEVPPSGEWWNARVHPADYRRAVTDGIAAFDQGFASYSLEYRVRHRDGHYVDVWDRAIVQRNDAGRAVRVFGHVIDVSERKRAERQLYERVAEFETLMETVPVPIWIAHDPECRLITGNSAGYRLLRQAPGSNLSRTAPQDERPSFRVFRGGVELDGDDLPMQYAARHGVPVDETELDLVFGEGDVTTVYGYAAPLFSAEGAVRGCIGVYIDVTERRRLDEERARLFAAERQSREEAQAAVRVRDSFLSIAAHELKTPLTVMLGNAQLLQRRAEAEAIYSERDRRAIRAVAAQTQRLERMIATLLDISRIEAGQLRITRAPFDLGALALRLVQEIRPTLSDHSIVYVDSGPVPILGDELRIEQVLQNLISNAVKYSPSGGPITLRAWAADGRAMVSVTDQGIGIPEADMAHLFSRFFRGTNLSDNQISGIGIGLYVVKEIVNLHGGEVRVVSKPGEGTSVTVVLPLPGA